MSISDPLAELTLGNPLSDSFVFNKPGKAAVAEWSAVGDADGGAPAAGDGPVFGLEMAAGSVAPQVGALSAVSLHSVSSDPFAGASLQVRPTDVSEYVKPDASGGGGGGGKPAPAPDPSPGTLDTYTSGGEASSSYNITINFSGTWTAELQQAFVDVADFLSSVILGDVTDITRGRYATDDITISASLTDIDGSGGILGQAGPTAYRAATYLPAAGTMQFDIADASDFNAMGLWEEIVFHEMMHCLGFGTLFAAAGMTAGSIATGNLVFTGVNAAYEYGLLGGAGFVPLEMDGGSGTAGGHWDEGDPIMGEGEIMTGYIDLTNYLSMVTVAALEDFGYDTVYDDITTATDMTGTMPDTSFIFA